MQLLLSVTSSLTQSQWPLRCLGGTRRLYWPKGHYCKPSASAVPHISRACTDGEHHDLSSDTRVSNLFLSRGRTLTQLTMSCMDGNPFALDSFRWGLCHPKVYATLGIVHWGGLAAARTHLQCGMTGVGIHTVVKALAAAWGPLHVLTR